MSTWEKIGEEASIVLVGNFNPAIFHPEWFIRHQIVPAWVYQDQIGVTDDLARVAVLPDLAQVEFPDQRHLNVVLNKFMLRCSRASAFITIKDMVTRAFDILQETPVAQLGMNYQAIIHIEDLNLWQKFGQEMAPKRPWLEAAPYINDLDQKERDFLGLLEMTMQMPRGDKLKGYIRPTIKALNLSSRQLSISVNNHVTIEDSRALTMIDHLNEHWEGAVEFANSFITSVLNNQIGEV